MAPGIATRIVYTTFCHRRKGISLQLILRGTRRWSLGVADEHDGLVVDGGQVAAKLGVVVEPDQGSLASVPGNGYSADAHLGRRGLGPGEVVFAALVVLDRAGKTI